MTYQHKPLKRWQRNTIHGVTLAAIVIGLFIEGAKVADLGFLALSIATELEG